MDADEYERKVTAECLAMSGHQLPEQGTYQSQQHYTPYTVNMGQLTVYRYDVILYKMQSIYVGFYQANLQDFAYTYWLVRFCVCLCYNRAYRS